jgi:hypothetical protein
LFSAGERTGQSAGLTNRNQLEVTLAARSKIASHN